MDTHSKMGTAVSPSCCFDKSADVCTSTLVHISEIGNITRSRITKGVLSPWSYDHSVAATEASRARNGTMKIKRENSHCLTNQTWLPSNREESARASTRKKSARFRGALTTVLSNERRRPVEPGFQHFDDIQEYIEQYRALRHNLYHRPSWRYEMSDTESNFQNIVKVSFDGCNSLRKQRSSVGCTRHHDPPPTNPSIRITQSERVLQPGSQVPIHENIKLSQSGQPSQQTNHSPNRDKVRFRQSNQSSERLNHVTHPDKMSVRGNQMDSDKNIVYGERGRRRLHYGGLPGRKHHPAPGSHRCRKIYLTWRQYRKYFCAPGAAKENGQEAETSEGPDEDGGYLERCTTPPPAPAMPQRANTCAPVLNFDQSCVATPTSPFLQRAKQSKSSAVGQKSKDTTSRDQTPRNVECLSVGNTKGTRSSRPQTEDGVKVRQTTWYGNGDSYSRRKSALVGAGRPWLTTCTVVDIEEAIRDLTETLGNKKLLSKPAGTQTVR